MIGQTDADKRNSGAIGVLAEASTHDAAAEIDRVAAERLIRSTIETLARGAAVKDVDGLVQRNLGNITLADVRAGRLGSNVLGDIVNTVEQAKGNAPFNWNTATQEQIKAYLVAHGMPLPQSMMDSNRRGGQNDSRSSSGSDVSATAAITEANFKGSSLEKMGLSIDTFRAMQKEGFNSTQITAAVTANKTLGIQANDNPAATARLQRDTPWAVDSLKESHEGLKEANDCDERATRAEAKGDSAGALHWRRQAEEKRKAESEHHHRTQERLGKERPDRLPDYNDRYRRMNDNIENKLGADKRAAIENYRRNPNDAAARRDYKTALASEKTDPKHRLAVAEIEKDLRESQKAEAVEAKRNATDKAQGDNDLAFLNDEKAPDKPHVADAASSGPLRKASDNKREGSDLASRKDEGASEKARLAGAVGSDPLDTKAGSKVAKVENKTATTKMAQAKPASLTV